MYVSGKNDVVVSQFSRPLTYIIYLWESQIGGDIEVLAFLSPIKSWLTCLISLQPRNQLEWV